MLGAACDSCVFFSLSTLKNKELSPVIGQKGIQGTVTSSGQLQHSEHSPHTLRRGNELVMDLWSPHVTFYLITIAFMSSFNPFS